MRNLDFTSDSPQSIKLGDSNDVLSLRVTESNQPVDLSKVSSITVKIGNASGFLTDINVAVSSLLHPTDGRIDVVIDSKISSELPAGQYLLEVWIEDAQGNTVIYPDTSYPTVIGFSIKKNIMTATSTVITTLTLADFETKFDDMQKDLQDKVTSGYFKGDKGQSVWYFPYDAGANVLGRLWSDLKPVPTTTNPPKVGDNIIDLVGNFYQITNVVVGTTAQDGGTFDYGDLLTTIKGPKGDTGTVDNAGLISAPAFQSLQNQVDNSAVGTNLLTTPFSDSDKIVDDSPNTSRGYTSMIPYNNLIAGTVYTFSADVSVLGSATSIDVKPFDNLTTKKTIDDSYTTFPIVDGKISGLVKPTDGYNALIVYAGNKGNTHGNKVTFHHMKLEKGSVATDWSPNPSEILTTSDYAKIKAAIVALGGSLS